MVQSRVLLEKVVDKLGPAAILGEGPAVAATDNNKVNIVSADAAVIVQAAEKPGSAASGASGPAGGLKNGVKSFLGMPVMSDRDRALAQIAKNLKVEPARKSNVIDINYIAGSPGSAQAVVAALIDAYLAEHVRLNRPQGSHDFFAAQTSRLRDDLAKKEQALRDLRNRTGLASSRDQRKQIIERIGRLEDDLLEADTARAVSAGQSHGAAAQTGRAPRHAGDPRDFGLRQRRDGPHARSALCLAREGR